MVAGDLNVIRHDSDIYNPAWVKEGRPGLTDRERNSFENILTSCKLVDTFRKLYPLRLLVYSHWTERNPVARKNNWGTRMDYFLTSKRIDRCLIEQKYLPQIEGSDHCPVTLELDADKLKLVYEEILKKRGTEDSEMTDYEKL